MNDLTRNVISAGVGAVSTVCITHPIDLYKTKIQMDNTNLKPLEQIKSIYKSNGIKSFWKGIVPAMFRESTYTTLRIGLYEPVKKMFNITPDSNFLLKFFAGSLSGLIGSVVGNPFDVMKIKSMGNPESIGFVQLARQVYLQGDMYKGLSANLMRACVLNGTKMSCYDQIKSLVTKLDWFKSDLPVQFVSSFCAGFFMACTVTPFDMVRTRLMSQSGPNTNTLAQCVSGIIKTGGIGSFYSGFYPIWLRFAPATCFQLVIYDQAKTHLF